MRRSASVLAVPCSHLHLCTSYASRHTHTHTLSLLDTPTPPRRATDVPHLVLLIRLAIAEAQLRGDAGAFEAAIADERRRMQLMVQQARSPVTLLEPAVGLA